MNGRSEDRVALVTGGGKGVGAGVARVLCGAGIRCCVNCNSNPAMAEETVAAIRAAGGEAFAYQADVSDPAQVRAMVDAVVERYGRLDILVNNAAMQPNKYIDEYDAAALQRLWSINIGGYWRCAKAAIGHLRRSPAGRIVNMCSIHANRPTCFDAGYSMTKGAIRMFTRELALELTRDGITVNAITLGGCRIEFKTGRPKWDMQTPLDVINPALRGVNRLVEPADVGETILFLCSDRAAAITGDCIRIDRGLVLV
ncbi:MAG: SDR family oxidoreductase [Clostridia bacterium]|nr:SDR family oxidoreductase [Clostridia bacterium]